MKVAVGINAKNKNDFLNQLEKAKIFLPQNAALHIDISQKRFSSINSFFDFKILKKYSRYFKLEGHLMVPKNKILDKKWFSSPLDVLFIHSSVCPDWEKILKSAKQHKKEIGVVFDFDQKEGDIIVPKGIKKILLLSVIPGKSGQKFNSSAFHAIDFLRKKYPHAIISVDGGINLKIAKKLKNKKINNVVSTSYIWENKNPTKAYKKLISV